MVDTVAPSVTGPFGSMIRAIGGPRAENVARGSERNTGAVANRRGGGASLRPFSDHIDTQD